jgi:two-component system sensor histidine kinase FlrB
MSVSVPTEEQNTAADAPPPAAVAAATGIDELRAGQEGLRRAVAETSGRLAGRLRERTAVAARLGLILDSLPAAVVVVDAAGRVLQLSAQAAQLTGAAAGEVWSTVLARLTPTAVADEYLLDQRCLRVQQATTPAGDLLYTLADVSAEAARRTGLERERQLVALGQFAAHLAHQLRTPLAAALLHAGLLSHSDLDPGQREQVQALLDRLQHMQAYIGHAFDQLGDHAAAPPAVFALGPFLHGVVASMSGLAARRKVDLRLELPKDCGHITAWRVPLEGALSNLIDNAIHFSPAGGSVVLRAEADADRVRLTVTDQGPGIDRKLLSRIFEPFVSGREGGTGLGLAIARGVVERHGGELRADSRPGFGATFTVELPRQPGGGRS